LDPQPNSGLLAKKTQLIESKSKVLSNEKNSEWGPKVLTGVDLFLVFSNTQQARVFVRAFLNIAHMLSNNWILKNKWTHFILICISKYFCDYQFPSILFWQIVVPRLVQQQGAFILILSFTFSSENNNIFKLCII
jgi:hypothetical protein